MTSLKMLHDTETGEPKRIKYDGELVYVSFVIENMADSENGTTRTAVLDCLGSYEIESGDTTAFVDLDELQEAYRAVRQVPLVDRVDTPFAEVQE